GAACGRGRRVHRSARPTSPASRSRERRLSPPPHAGRDRPGAQPDSAVFAPRRDTSIIEGLTAIGWPEDRNSLRLLQVTLQDAQEIPDVPVVLCHGADRILHFLDPRVIDGAYGAKLKLST